MVRIILWTAVGLLWAATTVMAQTAPWRRPADEARPAGPDQPVRPQVPTLERRVSPQEPPQPPFQLTPQEEALVDRMLKLWEQRSAGVKTFECSFKRWEYDPVFGPADQARFEDLGSIKYATPDKGWYKVEGDRAEFWICDGKSIYEYNYVEKKVIERRLPPELQGRAIANGPLPFLFGARAESLKQRYFIRVVTPKEVQAQQTWLDVRPRFQADAANFKQAILTLTNQGMTPYALRLYAPNGKNYTSYAFYEIVLNDPLAWAKGNPFVAKVPSDWQKVLDAPSNNQANRVPPAGARK